MFLLIKSAFPSPSEESAARCSALSQLGCFLSVRAVQVRAAFRGLLCSREAARVRRSLNGCAAPCCFAQDSSEIRGGRVHEEN